MKQTDEEKRITNGLPASIDAERAVLGAILLDNRKFYEAIEHITASDFALEGHRRIFARIKALLDAQKQADIITISEELRTQGQLQNVGGVASLAALTDGIATRTKIRHYCQIVRDKSAARRIIEIAELAARRSYEQSESVVEVLNDATRSLEEVATGCATDEVVTANEVAESVWGYIKTLSESDREVVGLPSSINELSETTTGYRDGEYNVVAGWTGSGKSAFALQEVDRNLDDLTPCAYFSAEMQRDELLLRLIAQRTNINYLKLRQPKWLERAQRERVFDELLTIKKLPLFIDDSASLEVDQLIARARRFASRGVKLFVFDYIQKFRARSEKEMRLQMNRVSEGIRDFLKSTKTTGLILSQLSKPKDGHREPQLYDLRETGAIGDDAHLVLMMYRPLNRDGEFTFEDKIIIAKQRSGPTGFVPVRFFGENLRFKWRERAKPKTEEKPPLIAAAEKNILGESANA